MRNDLLTPMPSGEVVALGDTASHPTTKAIATLLTDNGYDANHFGNENVVEITPSTSVHWTYGVTPVATTAHPVLSAGLTRQMRVPKNEKLAFIKMDGADNGNVYVHPCRE